MKVTSLVKIALSVLYVALIFVAAGTIHWPRLWFFLGFYVISTSAFMIWLKKRDPGLLKEELPGYDEYAAKVRWKLLPKVW
jgi:protein-S-isoprenylcysteine O-methyltransferase Ste14